MQNNDDPYQQAETCRKNKQFAEAEAGFRRLWAQKSARSVGWRLAFCLRKLARTQEALQVITAAHTAFPDDRWTNGEYAWCLYEHDVKPARDDEDLGRTMHHAQKMIDLSPEPLVLQKAIFAVLKVAKKRGKWQVVQQWGVRLDPGGLSAEITEVGGRRIMSDREQWYFGLIKARITLEQWAEARSLAQEAAEIFPRQIHFARWAALARAGAGDLMGAAQELEALVRRNNQQWYLLHDLAKIKHKLGQAEESLVLACRAALASGEDKAKVNLFALLASVALSLDLAEFAAQSVALAKAVRESEGWPVPQDLSDLEQQISARLPATIPTDQLPSIGPLRRVCREGWQEYATIGQPRHRGWVCRLPEGRNFAFITPDGGGENVYIQLRNLPQPAHKIGAAVEYTLESSFDQTKKHDSVCAIDVRLVR